MMAKSSMDSLKRVVGLEKIALLGGLTQSLYLGRKIDGMGNAGDSSLYSAAYDINEKHKDVDDGISHEESKEVLGKAIAALSIALGAAGKISALKAIPAAIISLGYGASHGSKADEYKRLAGRDVLLGRTGSAF